jgi:hypothetical protein
MGNIQQLALSFTAGCIQPGIFEGLLLKKFLSSINATKNVFL